MLTKNINDFLIYIKVHNFSKRSQDVLGARLTGFNRYLNTLKLKSIKEIEYSNLTDFIMHNNPSVHVKKPGIWALRQFFHYLKLKGIIQKNISCMLPYPKIDIKEPDFFSIIELKKILHYFVNNSNSFKGLRNLIIILFLSFLGLRISSVIDIDIQDIDLKASNILVKEKGSKKRVLPLPQIICFFLHPYIKSLEQDIGPLFTSNRSKRLSCRMVQHLFQKTSKELDIHIYSHRFRHTAATFLNQVSGICITKEVLGHKRMKNTERYVHLNPDIYVEYMKRHPYMKVEV